MDIQKLSKYQKRHVEFVNNKVAKAIIDNKLISNDDKVLVAVSGGKDSLVLLYALATLRQYGFFNYTIEAVHINMIDVDYSTNAEAVSELCNSINVKFTVINTESHIESREKKSPCFVCSWHRRKALFTYANEHGFKKIAFGHHIDDAVETLLINMAYHGNISALPAKLSMFNDEIFIIRPLMLLTNKDTQEFANIKNFPKQIKDCPYEDVTNRTVARNFIKQLKAIHPKANKNIYRSLKNIDFDYL